MPHIVVEYSADLDQQLDKPALLSCLYQAAWDTGLFALESEIKVRAIAYEHFSLGNAPMPFMHITASILSGRSLEQRQGLSTALAEAIKALPSVDVLSSVEVHEMEKASYFKV